MTAARERTFPAISVDDGVYAPQEDSFLLCSEIVSLDILPGARVLDLCTGSGIAAIEAARNGAREVFAYDISERAVACAEANSAANGTTVNVCLGTLDDALHRGPFDVVVSNPPYVPSRNEPVGMGLNRAWDAGDRGRTVLDLLCASMPALLALGGTAVFVQSELADVDESLRQLRSAGLDAEVVRRQTIDFGPVMHERASWLEATDQIDIGCRHEELAVIRSRRR
ncbi:HemK2/MTQ2 family protein methyltransferase [Rhodococcoides kyotonense]|uniref:Release factor glutamine methyltransferase n=1 Tax=Rhodococcoides kyotonense TaxID=398843 RepID=A0A239LHM5_9NOCA|nr:HemK2/MTQ2 family protein methyltransferase [Rhodococcus kyotonensis]SNT29971.1 release factor glutamine methyltransferase [Rhodococcus kyotonensis]